MILLRLSLCPDCLRAMRASTDTDTVQQIIKKNFSIAWLSGISYPADYLNNFVRPDLAGNYDFKLDFRQQIYVYLAASHLLSVAHLCTAAHYL